MRRCPRAAPTRCEAANAVLTALYAERKKLARTKSKSPGIGSPKLTVGLISGGINTNVVPDRIVMRLDRRLIPEENGAKVETRSDRADQARRQAQGHFGRDSAHHPRRAAEASQRHRARWSRPLRRHARKILGVAIKPTGVPLYTDARHYSAKGIPTVLYGAGPRSILEANAHGADEHIKLSDLKAATKIVEATLRDLSESWLRSR